MRIDSAVDERRDPVKATDAALEFLSDLYQRFGSYYLAAAAYNAGGGKILVTDNTAATIHIDDDSFAITAPAAWMIVAVER